jgi:hypothetical protein
MFAFSLRTETIKDMNRKSLLTLTVLLQVVAIIGQKVKPIDPDEILLHGRKVPKVLLVGSWHFDYPGLDAHVTKDEDQINIYSEKKQKELDELLDYLAIFRPTKILVESGPITGYLKYNFKEWKAGKEELMSNERSQIGMRLVERFQLDTIYGVDDWPLIMDLHYDSILTNIPYLDAIYQAHYFGGSDTIQKTYKKFAKYKENFQYNNTLLESFQYINDDKVLNKSFGAYIAGGQFASDENQGPDALSMFWLNRNLRIYKNIQEIKSDENDRILILFGAGHISILRWLFECSSEYELIKFNDLERISPTTKPKKNKRKKN